LFPCTPVELTLTRVVHPKLFPEKHCLMFVLEILGPALSQPKLFCITQHPRIIKICARFIADTPSQGFEIPISGVALRIIRCFV
jgi:hypothetical protein